MESVFSFVFLPQIDYVGFIKKIMKLLQKGYNEIQGLEVELRILEQTSAPPSRPREYFFFVITKLYNLYLIYFIFLTKNPS